MTRRRRRRRNPSESNYWIGFGLVASAVLIVLIGAKKLAGAPKQLPAPQ